MNALLIPPIGGNESDEHVLDEASVNPPIGGNAGPPSKVDAFVAEKLKENPVSTGRGKRGKIYSLKQVAEMTHQKLRTMERIAAITNRGGIPELLEAMGKGIVSVAAAAEIARLPGMEYQLFAIEHRFTAKRTRDAAIKNGWVPASPEETLRSEAVRLAASLYGVLHTMKADTALLQAVGDVYRAMGGALTASTEVAS